MFVVTDMPDAGTSDIEGLSVSQVVTVIVKEKSVRTGGIYIQRSRAMPGVCESSKFLVCAALCLSLSLCSLAYSSVQHAQLPACLSSAAGNIIIIMPQHNNIRHCEEALSYYF